MLLQWLRPKAAAKLAELDELKQRAADSAAAIASGDELLAKARRCADNAVARLETRTAVVKQQVVAEATSAPDLLGLGAMRGLVRRLGQIPIEAGLEEASRVMAGQIRGGKGKAT